MDGVLEILQVSNTTLEDVNLSTDGRGRVPKGIAKIIAKRIDHYTALNRCGRGKLRNENATVEELVMLLGSV